MVRAQKKDTLCERTKREIAAYVAEGSIEADKAVAMLRASDGDVEA